MKEDTPLEDLFGAEALDAARDVRPSASLRPRLMAAAALLGFAGFGLLGAAVDRSFADQAVAVELGEDDLYGLAPLLVDERIFSDDEALDQTAAQAQYRLLRELAEPAPAGTGEEAGQ